MICWQQFLAECTLNELHQQNIPTHDAAFIYASQNLWINEIFDMAFYPLLPDQGFIMMSHE